MANLLRRKNIDAIRADLDSSESESGLHRNLNLFDLVCFGIAAIVGAGSFPRSVQLRPMVDQRIAVVHPDCDHLFVLCAMLCRVRGSGYRSAAAPTLMPMLRWGNRGLDHRLALLMEYAIGNSTVAFSWSEYFSRLIDGVQINNWRLVCPIGLRPITTHAPKRLR